MKEEKILSDLSEQELGELKKLFDDKQLQSFAFKLFQNIKKKKEIISMVDEDAYYQLLSSSIGEGMKDLYSELNQHSIKDIISATSKLIRGLMIDIDSMLVKKAIDSRLK